MPDGRLAQPVWPEQRTKYAPHIPHVKPQRSVSQGYGAGATTALASGRRIDDRAGIPTSHADQPG